MISNKLIKSVDKRKNVVYYNIKQLDKFAFKSDFMVSLYFFRLKYQEI